MNTTIVNRCYQDPNGPDVLVQLKKLNADGSWTWHRARIEPGMDPAAVLAAVNDHIALLNVQGVSQRATRVEGGGPDTYFDRVEEHALLPDAEIAKVAAVCAGLHTVQVVAAVRERKAAMIAQQEDEDRAAAEAQAARPPQEKLAALGLTADDLKAVLAK